MLRQRHSARCKAQSPGPPTRRATLSRGIDRPTRHTSISASFPSHVFPSARCIYIFSLPKFRHRCFSLTTTRYMAAQTKSRGEGQELNDAHVKPLAFAIKQHICARILKVSPMPWRIRVAPSPVPGNKAGSKDDENQTKKKDSRKTGE